MPAGQRSGGRTIHRPSVKRTSLPNVGMTPGYRRVSAEPGGICLPGGRRRGHDVALRALDDRVELAALALGDTELREGLVEVVMNVSHSAPSCAQRRRCCATPTFRRPPFTRVEAIDRLDPFG